MLLQKVSVRCMKRTSIHFCSFLANVSFCRHYRKNKKDDDKDQVKEDPNAEAPLYSNPANDKANNTAL